MGLEPIPVYLPSSGSQHAQLLREKGSRSCDKRSRGGGVGGCPRQQSSPFSIFLTSILHPDNRASFEYFFSFVYPVNTHQASSGSRDGIGAMSWRQAAMKQILLLFPFLFCNLMPLPYWNIVDLWFCACQCTAVFFSYDVYIQHICAFLDSVSIMVIAEGRGKFHLLNIRSLWNIY